MEIGLTLVPTTSALSLSNPPWLCSCCFYFYPRSPPSLLLPLVLLSRLVLADSTTLSHFFLPSWLTARPPPAHLSQAGATLLLPALPQLSHTAGDEPLRARIPAHTTLTLLPVTHGNGAQKPKSLGFSFGFSRGASFELVPASLSRVQMKGMCRDDSFLPSKVSWKKLQKGII